MSSQIKQAIQKTRGPDSRGWEAGQPARGQCTRIVFVAAILFIDLNACAVFAQIPPPRTVPDPNVKLAQNPPRATPAPPAPGIENQEGDMVPQIPALPEGFGRDQVRLPSLGDAALPLGKTPVPNAETLQKYGQYVDKVIDPENTFDAIVGRPRVMILKQIPTRFQLEEERIARAIPFFENKQLSITGLRVGTTILNLWFGDP
ncbi:MAG TPA: hypothetical protein VFB30_09115, partial [Spirochaetia bacterium]|nr:hypothetical protein [Spirochaetia bacterium]